MRRPCVLGILLAGASFAQTLPTFQLDPSRWLESQRRSTPLKQEVKAPAAAATCAIRLREIETPSTATTTIVPPDASKTFSGVKATLPAPACDKR